MRESQDIYLLRYRYHPILTASFLIVAIIIIGGLIVDYDQRLWAKIVGLLVVVTTFFGVFALLFLPRKEFQIKVDRKNMIMIVDRGLYRKKLPPIDLTKVHGIALSSQTTNHYTSYNLQLRTDAKTWGTFKGKTPQQIQQLDADYQEMYIVINIANQKKAVVTELYQFFLGCGISEKTFTRTILGSYQGVPRKKVRTLSGEARLTPLEKRLKVKQMISYFLMTLILSFSIGYLVLKFVGLLHGIYW